MEKFPKVQLSLQARIIGQHIGTLKLTMRLFKKKTKLSSRSNFSQLLRTSVEKVLMIPVFGPP